MVGGVVQTDGVVPNPHRRDTSTEPQDLEGELQDTGSSPIKNTLMDLDKPSSSGDSGTKRSLNMALDISNTAQGGTVLNELALQLPANGQGMQEVMEENESAEVDQSKRQRKDGAVSPSLGSAGSREEPVRSQ
jgi:hypothetical protein